VTEMLMDKKKILDDNASVENDGFIPINNLSNGSD
jgi:hypothetical protein